MLTNSRMPTSAQLAAVAAALDAAEGEAGVGLHDAVDEDAAGLDLGGQAPRRAPRPRVQTLAPRPKRERLAQLDRLVRRRGRGSPPPRGRRSPRRRRACRAARRRGRSERRTSPGRRAACRRCAGGRRPRPSGAPGRRDPSSRSSRARGPTSVARSAGSPTFSSSMRRDQLLLEAVGDRLLDDEALGRDAALAGVDGARAAAAWRAASTGSASARTMNGSEPPSSSTVFLSPRPASAATSMPARSLPVRVTARTAGCRISLAPRGSTGSGAWRRRPRGSRRRGRPPRWRGRSRGRWRRA